MSPAREGLPEPIGGPVDHAFSNGRRKLRIVVVAPPWFQVPPAGYGGIERICFQLVEGLVCRGHDVTLIGTGRSTTQAHFIQALPTPPIGLGDIEAPVQEARYAAIVARLLSRVDADLIHDHSLAGPLAGLGRSIPTLVTAHGPCDGFLGDYYRHLGLPLVALSQSQRTSAPDLPWVGTVGNGIDVDNYPFRGIKDDYVLFLGRLSPEKGAHLAVAAASVAGVKLVVAGKCSERHERRYFEELVRPRLASEAAFVGEVAGARKLDLIARARCLVCPAQWEEPFGISSVEALACGTPVVALRRGSLPEIVDHARTGFLCDSPDELPAAITAAHSIDPRTCRRDARSRFDSSVMVEGYKHIYNRVVAAAAVDLGA